MALSRRTFVIVTLALAAGVVLLLAVLYLGSGGPLEVVSAEYGVPGRTCSATTELQKAVTAGCDSFRPRCLLTVGSGWCGDPAPGALKTLTVEYRCGTTRKQASGTDLSGVTLACP